LSTSGSISFGCALVAGRKRVPTPAAGNTAFLIGAGIRYKSHQRAIDRKEEIASEIADVSILLFELADNLGIPLGQAILAKIDRNEERYPVSKAKGSNKKYNVSGDSDSSTLASA
jgi:hypothetical protein